MPGRRACVRSSVHVSARVRARAWVGVSAQVPSVGARPEPDGALRTRAGPCVRARARRRGSPPTLRVCKSIRVGLSASIRAGLSSAVRVGLSESIQSVRVGPTCSRVRRTYTRRTRTRKYAHARARARTHARKQASRETSKQGPAPRWACAAPQWQPPAEGGGRSCDGGWRGGR
jgi:hypothetical protein